MPQQKILYLSAKKLRKSGKSYSEINKELGIARSTLSCWFATEKWSQSVRNRINNKWKKRNARHLIKLNKAKKQETIKRHNQYKEEAAEEFKFLKNDPLFLVGISLYWGEGEKAKQGRVSIINSDLKLQQVTVNFYRKCLKVPNHKLRIALFVYEDHDQLKVQKIWSEQLKIPKNQFIKTQVLPTRKKLTKNKLVNGICNLYFSDTKMHVKIIEWIKLLGIDMRM